MIPTVRAEEPAQDRLSRVEARLERIEALLEKVLEAQGAGTPATTIGDTETDAAIQRVEKRYGVGSIAATLLGQGQAHSGVPAQVQTLHRQLLTLIYEGGEKAKVDPDLVKVLSALLKMRAADLASANAQSGPYRSPGPLLTDSVSGMRGSGRVGGEQAKALAPLLVECLRYPALERFAAAEAHLFPESQVVPALQKTYDATSAAESARRQRLLAALAACGDAKASLDIKAAIDKNAEDSKSLQTLTRYAAEGKAFGLYALAKLAEEEMKAANRSISGANGGYGAGHIYQLMQLCGKTGEYSDGYRHAMANLTDEEKNDHKKIQSLYAEVMQRTGMASVKWVFDKYDKLVWDADGRVFLAR